MVGFRGRLWILPSESTILLPFSEVKKKRKRKRKREERERKKIKRERVNILIQVLTNYSPQAKFDHTHPFTDCLNGAAFVTQWQR